MSSYGRLPLLFTGIPPTGRAFLWLLECSWGFPTDSIITPPTWTLHLKLWLQGTGSNFPETSLGTLFPGTCSPTGLPRHYPPTATGSSVPGNIRGLGASSGRWAATGSLPFIWRPGYSLFQHFRLALLMCFPCSLCIPGSIYVPCPSEQSDWFFLVPLLILPTCWIDVGLHCFSRFPDTHYAPKARLYTL